MWAARSRAMKPQWALCLVLLKATKGDAEETPVPLSLRKLEGKQPAATSNRLAKGWGLLRSAAAQSPPSRAPSVAAGRPLAAPAGAAPWLTGRGCPLPVRRRRRRAESRTKAGERGPAYLCCSGLTSKSRSSRRCRAERPLALFLFSFCLRRAK